MIIPLIAPNIDLGSLVSLCEKELCINPLSGTDSRRYPHEDFRVKLNCLRLSDDYKIEDLNIQGLINLGYLIKAKEDYLLKISSFMEFNIRDEVGIFVGSLKEWRECLIRLMIEETPPSLREELFQIYNHLNFLKLGYLFEGYKIKGHILHKSY